MDSRWDAMKAAKKVSIPMTVLGGLQFYDLQIVEKEIAGFNTDDGIRRAAILCP